MSIECQKINGTTEYETPQFWNKKKLYKAGRPVPPEVSHQKREENYSVSLSLTPLISVPPVPNQTPISPQQCTALRIS